MVCKLVGAQCNTMCYRCSQDDNRGWKLLMKIWSSEEVIWIWSIMHDIWLATDSGLEEGPPSLVLAY